MWWRMVLSWMVVGDLAMLFKARQGSVTPEPREQGPQIGLPRSIEPLFGRLLAAGSA